MLAVSVVSHGRFQRTIRSCWMKSFVLPSGACTKPPAPSDTHSVDGVPNAGEVPCVKRVCQRKGASPRLYVTNALPLVRGYEKNCDTRSCLPARSSGAENVMLGAPLSVKAPREYSAR